MNDLSKQLYEISDMEPRSMKIALLRLAAEQEAAELKLANQRNRTRKCRQAKTEKLLQSRYGDVTVTCDGNVTVTGHIRENSSVTNLSITNLPITLSTAPAEGGKKRRVKSRLTADWELPPEYLKWSAEKGMLADEAEREGAKFLNHWLSKAESRADWFATWRNWCLNFIERRHRFAANGAPSFAKPLTQAQKDAQVRNEKYAKLKQYADSLPDQDEPKIRHQLGKPDNPFIPPNWGGGD